MFPGSRDVLKLGYAPVHGWWLMVLAVQGLKRSKLMTNRFGKDGLLRMVPGHKTVGMSNDGSPGSHPVGEALHNQLILCDLAPGQSSSCLFGSWEENRGDWNGDCIGLRTVSWQEVELSGRVYG
jgi:hypothetical protein